MLTPTLATAWKANSMLRLKREIFGCGPFLLPILKQVKMYGDKVLCVFRFVPKILSLLIYSLSLPKVKQQ